MRIPGFSKFELQVMNVFWERGEAARAGATRGGEISIRAIQETFPEPKPAYTTVQTIVHRLEKKEAVRRVRKVGNAHVFEAVVNRNAANRRLVDQVFELFGGRIVPLMAHWAESGNLSADEIAEAERLLSQLSRPEGDKARKKERES